MTTDASAVPAFRMLRGALVPTLVVGATGAVLAGVVAGSHGVWGALLGLALVIVFFGLGLAVLRACAGVEPTLVLLIALGLYVAKVVLIGGAFLLMETTGVLRGFADHVVLGVTAIACTLAWTVGESVAAARARQPAYDVEVDGPDARAVG